MNDNSNKLSNPNDCEADEILRLLGKINVIGNEKIPLVNISKWARSGKLILSPDFQRNFVWDKKKQSNLILSILRGAPIDSIYLWERENERYEVVDGQQRNTTYINFVGIPTNNVDGNELIKPNFKLKIHKDDPLFPHLNGKTFRELPAKLQDKIEEYNVNVIVFSKETTLEQIKEYFRVKNMGVTIMNKGELRVSDNTSPITERLKKMTKDSRMMELVGKQHFKLSNRMKLENFVLAFFAMIASVENKKLVWNIRKEYKSSNLGNEHLDDIMEDLSELDTTEADRLEEVFLGCLELCYKVFGPGVAFRSFDANSNTFEQNKIQVSLFLAQMRGFAPYVIKKQKSQFTNIEAKDHLMGRLKCFMIDMNELVIQRSKKETENVRVINAWCSVMEQNYPIDFNGPRFFPEKDKKRRYAEQGGVCAITGLRYRYEDMEGHHWIPTAQGGKTVYDNLAMVVKEENRKMGKKMPEITLDEALASIADKATAVEAI